MLILINVRYQYRILNSVLNNKYWAMERFITKKPRLEADHRSSETISAVCGSLTITG